MAIDANSYGTVLGVASLVPRWTNSGTGDSATFSGTSRPTLTQVETYIDQVSGMLNSILAENGFDVPVTTDNVKDAIDLFANMEVATICDGVNGSGRFGPSDKASGGRGRFSLLMEDVKEFIGSNASGFERMGATREFSYTFGLSFRDSDNAGNAISPIFQRGNFGNVFEDADPV